MESPICHWSRLRKHEVWELSWELGCLRLTMHEACVVILWGRRSPMTDRPDASNQMLASLGSHKEIQA